MERGDRTTLRTLLSPVGAVSPESHRPRFKENNGNSFMFFTIVVAIITPCMIVMAQQAPCLATRIIFTIFAALSAIFAAIGFLLLSYREWNQQLVEVSPKFLVAAMPVFLADVPWRIWRLADCVCAWVLAVANLILVFWIWDTSADKSTYFLFCDDHRGCTNIWSGWNLSILQSINYFTATSSDLHVKGQLAVLLASIASLVAWFIGQLVSVAAVAKAMEMVKIQIGSAEGGSNDKERANIERAIDLIVVEVAKRMAGERQERKQLRRRRPRTTAAPELSGFEAAEF